LFPANAVSQNRLFVPGAASSWGMNFQVVPLQLKEFLPLFELSDPELAKDGARRMIVSANPGFPCRISLEDAEIWRARNLVQLHASAN
jgi:hypothetical protein